MTTIVLPFDAPLLRANDRDHYHVKAGKTRKVRQATALLARDIEPMTAPVSIRFVWTTTDKIRRDPDGSFPTAKAAIDGLVDAGVIPDDRFPIVTSVTLAMESGEKSSCRIEIQEDQ